MWAVTVLSIIGVVLNIHKRSECFLVWSLTNAAWMLYDFSIGAYAQAVLFAVYLVLAIWGLLKWRRERGRELWEKEPALTEEERINLREIGEAV